MNEAADMNGREESKTVVFRFNIFFYLSCFSFFVNLNLILIIIWKLFFVYDNWIKPDSLDWVICLNHKVPDKFILFLVLYTYFFLILFCRPNIVVFPVLSSRRWTLHPDKTISTCFVKMCELLNALSSHSNQCRNRHELYIVKS